LPYKIYSTPESIHNYYSVYVKDTLVPLHEARVSAYPFNRRWPGHQRPVEQSELAYFVSFEMDEPVQIKICPQKSFKEVIIRPMSKGICPEVVNGTIYFTLSKSGGYTVELDGYHHALHIFADPVKKYAVDIKSENTIYFGAGIHDAGIINVKSNQTVFIDEGSVVYACIHGENSENIRILGRGILDNSKNMEEILFEVDKFGDGSFDVGNAKRLNTIQFKNCNHIEIDGITIRDSLLYNITTWGCEDLLVDNVKIIGCWRYNSDGIDMHNSSKCTVRNCFLRTYDDSICVKGHDGYSQLCEDILIENCVVWNDWGQSLHIGAETRAEKMCNITFRNCDVIRNTYAAMSIANVDYGEVYNVLYEDIRVECDHVCQKPQFQINDETNFIVDYKCDFLPKLMSACILKHHEYSEGKSRRGKIHDITFQNIKLFSNRMLPSFFEGFDSEHKINNIYINGLYLNKRQIADLNEAKVTISSFADNILLK